MRSIISHILPTDASIFWENVFFDQEFTQRMYSDVLGMGDVEMLAQTGSTRKRMTRRLRCSKGMEMFAALAKRMGAGFSIIEEGTFSVDKNGHGLWKFEVIPSSCAEKVSLTGVLGVKRVRPGWIESKFVIDCNVKILGLGSMVERLMARAVKENFGKVAVFAEDFIQEKGHLAA
jgi:hypothetical protein